MKRNIRSFTALLLLLTLFLCGCGQKSSAQEASENTETAAADVQEVRDAFDRFTDDLFAEIISTDALTLHYELANPSLYDIVLESIDLGLVPDVYDASDMETEKEEYARLQEFSYDSLSRQQQVTYDLLEEYYKSSETIDAEKFFYFSEPLTVPSGQHSLLPVLMAEYAFYDKEDVETYITLLEDFPSYFSQILAFEQAKAKAGLFMSDDMADSVIEACRTFIETPESNALIEVFPEKLQDLPDLTDAEKKDFTDRNQKAVLEAVIPAYQDLADGLTALKGSGTNELGLCFYENGKEYYSLLAAQESGTGLTPEELIDMIDTRIDEDMNYISQVIQKDSKVYFEWMGDLSVGTDDPKEMISMLQKAIKKDFPAAYTEDYLLKYVPESLEESMNPAFYLQPPVDLPDRNVIYLNKAQIGDNNLYLFNTLAHEGFPGHLYQITYYSSTDAPDLRKVMSYTAYTEGWASYVEHMANKWTGVSEKLAQVLERNDEITLCLYARIDLGVHYEGWDKNDIMTYLSDYGIGDADTAQEILDYIIGDPGSYLPYAIGALEFSGLAREAADFAGDDFSLQDFHKYILDIGPCSFTVLRQHMAKDGLLPVGEQKAALAR